MAKVLIVDDDFEIVGLLTEILNREGHQVEAAYEPAEGMRKVRTLQPDLVIMDYHMPGMTGAHLYESLRRNPSSQETPILFLSGEAAPEQILGEIADSRSSRFLSKPVKLAEFRRVVAELIGGGKDV